MKDSVCVNTCLCERERGSLSDCERDLVPERVHERGREYDGGRD